MFVYVLFRLTLDEIAAAAEMILAQEEDHKEEEEWQDSSDEGIGDESDCEGDCEDGEGVDGDLGDSGYGGGVTPPMDSR